MHELNDVDEMVRSRLRTVMAGARPHRSDHSVRPADVQPPAEPDTAARLPAPRTRPADARPADARPADARPADGRLSALGAFDPGRPGVRALAVLAVLVVLVAAVLAWRARPRAEPVVATPAPAGGSGPFDAPAVPSSGPPGEVVVAVAGKVRKPGLVRLPTGSRVADALQAAGGAKPGIDVALLNLARKVVDGELILVGVAPAGPPGAPAGPAGAGGRANGQVNLNTATLAELDGLPGVGPVLAQRILDRRAELGGFTAVSDLRQVDGIGSSRYEKLKDLVTV